MPVLPTGLMRCLKPGRTDNEFYGNRDQRNSNYQKDTALALRIDPLKNIVLKIEGHIIDGTSLLIDGTGAKKDWYLFVTKATFSF